MSNTNTLEQIVKQNTHHGQIVYKNTYWKIAYFYIEAKNYYSNVISVTHIGKKSDTLKMITLCYDDAIDMIDKGEH